jgi:uncharacterized membrane protein
MHRHDKQRYLFIDLLRFLAVVFMLQGHTFDALLQTTIKHASFFYIHDFFHGFVAPMFLFASGVAFGVSTFKKWEIYIRIGSPVFRRIGRFLGLLIIGYALHLPFFSLTKLLHESTPSDIAALLQVDALQCIAVTLVGLQLLVLLVKSEDRFALVSLTIAMLTMFLSPIVWNYPFIHVLPLSLTSYLNASNNSWFPLFPWSGYLFFGVSFAYVFVEAKEHHHAIVLMKRVAVLGTGVIVAAFVLSTLPFSIYPSHDFWKVNPLVTMARMGFLFVVMSGLYFLEQSVRITSSIPKVMGKESLVIYVLHLVLIYGSVINSGLQLKFGGSLSILGATGVFLLVFFAMSVFAYVWDVIKNNYKKESMLLKFALAAVFLFYFITRPY